MNTQYNLAIRKSYYMFADIIEVDDQAVRKYVEENRVEEGDDLYVELQIIEVDNNGDKVREIDIVFRGIIQYDSNETILDIIKNKVIKDKEEKLTLIDNIGLEVE